VALASLAIEPRCWCWMSRYLIWMPKCA
jgi:hypothetical protein